MEEIRRECGPYQQPCETRAACRATVELRLPGRGGRLGRLLGRVTHRVRWTGPDTFGFRLTGREARLLRRSTRVEYRAVFDVPAHDPRAEVGRTVERFRLTRP